MARNFHTYSQNKKYIIEPCCTSQGSHEMLLAAPQHCLNYRHDIDKFSINYISSMTKLHKKVKLSLCATKTNWEWRYRSMYSQPRLWMDTSGLLHTPAFAPGGRSPSANCIGNLVDLSSAVSKRMLHLPACNSLVIQTID
jgi:hypothetical protein